MHNFDTAKKQAIDKLYEMNKRATKTNNFKAENSANKTTKNAQAPTLSLNQLLSNDELIIMGLFLILSKDCHDNWLFLSLLYILL